MSRTHTRPIGLLLLLTKSKNTITNAYQAKRLSESCTTNRLNCSPSNSCKSSGHTQKNNILCRLHEYGFSPLFRLVYKEIPPKMNTPYLRFTYRRATSYKQKAMLESVYSQNLSSTLPTLKYMSINKVRFFYHNK